ncbi:ATP-binding cassette domain-containing protein [candidate division GN15 bacterium]|nr:ATP-binding cassette domain-containing protein [candidate division GN15 bacterium]
MNPPTKEPVIELNSILLRNERGGYVFRDLSLTLPPGDSVIVTGASGSGKTMLIKLLLGAAFPERGTVKLFGGEIRRRSRRRIKQVRRKIGGVGGMFSLMPSLTVAENIAYPLMLQATPRKAVRERLLKMLSEFALLKLANQYPSHLTRVENHLVQFARAAIGNQPLILIDEPAAGLDPENHARVFEFLVKVALSGRSMVIVVSDPPTEQIPNTRLLRLVNGGLE